MLEELEKLALELGQALPRIVVTCSAESLSSRRTALTNSVAGSAELLHPPPATVNAIGGGCSLAKEKCRLVEFEPEPVSDEEPAKASTSSSSVVVSSPSGQSLSCIYLPEVSVYPPPHLRHLTHTHHRLALAQSWRLSSCPAARPLPFCSPQTASTANLPHPPPRAPVPCDSAPSSPPSETGNPRGPRAAASPGASQQQPQSASRPKPKLKPKSKMHPSLLHQSRRDPASRRSQRCQC